MTLARKRGSLCAGLPRISLCSVLPTPLEEAPRLSQAVGGTHLWFKRDDLTGLALGGNKIRNMEFIFGEMLHQGCDSVITTAGVHSNMCRAAAAAASRLGLQAVLLLRGSGEEERQGNLLLDELLGADIRFIPTQDPYDPRVAVWLKEVKQELEGKGYRPYILHLTGITSTVATAAYVEAAEELTYQFDALNIKPDYLFLTVGSGITMSGLVLGFKHLGKRIRVVGISGGAKAEFLSERIVRYANQTAALLGLSTRIRATDFTVHDQYVGPGYGIPHSPVIAAIRKVAKLEGILLDPVYTGKCMSGLLDQIEKGQISQDHCVVLLHSGGVPNLFQQSKTLST